MRFLNLTSIKPSRGLALATVAVVSALAVGATFSSVFNFRSSGGSLSAYLISPVNGQNHHCFGTACGAYDPLANSDTIEVVVRLGNPTGDALRAWIAIYRRNGGFQGCTIRDINPNTYVDVNLVDRFGLFDTHDFTVKVLTLNLLNRVQAGVKGWLTHFTAQTNDTGSITNRFLHMRETEMQEVPIEVAKADEADRILNDCPL